MFFSLQYAFIKSPEQSCSHCNLVNLQSATVMISSFTYVYVLIISSIFFLTLLVYILCYFIHSHSLCFKIVSLEYCVFYVYCMYLVGFSFLLAWFISHLPVGLTFCSSSQLFIMSSFASACSLHQLLPLICD